MPAKVRRSSKPTTYVNQKTDDSLLGLVAPYHETNLMMEAQGHDNRELYTAIKELLVAILHLKCVHAMACEKFRPDWDGLRSDTCLLRQVQDDIQGGGASGEPFPPAAVGSLEAKDHAPEPQEVGARDWELRGGGGVFAKGSDEAHE